MQHSFNTASLDSFGQRGYIALITDIARGSGHIEALPFVFDSPESIKNYAARRLNVRVTIVVQVVPVQVPLEIKLVNL